MHRHSTRGGYHPIYSDFLPDAWTPTRASLRCVTPVRYYYVDFGMSSYFPDDSVDKLVVGQDGLDQEVPELSPTIPYDPFKVDVFILGNVFKSILYKVCNLPKILLITHLRPA